MRRAFLLTFAAAAALAGCDGAAGGKEARPAPSPAPGAESVPDVPRDEGDPVVNAAEPDADACGADKLGRWLNALPTETVKADIRDAVGHDHIRYIAPGDVVTMDFSPGRLNVETGADGRIKRFRCG